MNRTSLTARMIGAATRLPARQRRQRRNPLPHRRRRAREQHLDRVFPDLLELFVVTVQAGAFPFEAIGDLRPMVDPVLGEALDAVIARVERGDRFADALDALVEHLGPRALTLASTIAAAERSGLPLAPSIERIADEARQHRRRQAEASARELPVRLTFPLVLCTLPSFILVSIVPLLIGALSSLRST